MITNIEFYNELVLALTKEFHAADSDLQTSLVYAKNPVPTTPLVLAGKPFQVIIIGGSHLHCATVVRKNKALVVTESVKSSLPVMYSFEILMNILESYVKPETEVLALNFAYPMEVVNRNNLLDGRLISGTKEHTFDGLVGKIVGEEIEKEFQKRRNQTISVAVCNDTVSLGLAGVDYLESKNITHYQVAAGIVGTGFNFGFFTSPDMFINLESGNFSNFNQSWSATEIDKNSLNPGKQLFEKEVGGRYLWQHFNLKAEKQGLEIQISDTKELSELAEKNLTEIGVLASEVLERAAGMVAAEIAAVYTFLQEKTPATKLYVVIEGSVFWNAYRFSDAVKLILNQLVKDEIEIVLVHNSGILGTAKLVG